MAKLWIDFKLYFYVRIHKEQELQLSNLRVVNWFQIVFLREDSQASQKTPFAKACCELISNCIFTWGFTSFFFIDLQNIKLWIDFKLYFYVRIHKKNVNNDKFRSVVNWFQIVFLREDSQDINNTILNVFSCELISNCIFTWGFTREVVIGVGVS